jgi:hypothetical protein
MSGAGHLVLLIPYRRAPTRGRHVTPRRARHPEPGRVGRGAALLPGRRSRGSVTREVLRTLVRTHLGCVTFTRGLDQKGAAHLWKPIPRGLIHPRRKRPGILGALRKAVLCLDGAKVRSGLSPPKFAATRSSLSAPAKETLGCL